MITDLKIKNFRSLKDVELTGLQPVNLLIGPNNSGKSNILKALKFFGEFLEGKIPDRELSKILFYHFFDEKTLIESEPINFQFFSKITEQNTPSAYGHVSLFHYEKSEEIPPFAIVCAKGEFKILQDSIENVKSLYNSYPAFEAHYFSYPKDVILPPNIMRQPDKTGNYYRGKLLVRNFSDPTYSKTIPDPKLGYFRTDTQIQVFFPFQNIKIYRPEPSKLLELYPIQNEQAVNEDASNLAAFLLTMRNEYEHLIFDRIKEDLCQFLPEFKSISFQVEDTPNKEVQSRYPGKSLARIGLTDIYDRKFWSDSLSEGTLYFISLLCIIHQPKPPKLLLLEEPEKGIHPRRIRETMDLIFELAEEKGIQVILTTHSTAVVDTFADLPEAVYIVEREGQETKVKNLQRDVIEPHEEQFRAAGEEPIPFTDALGEHWAMGFLGGVPNDNY